MFNIEGYVSYIICVWIFVWTQALPKTELGILTEGFHYIACSLTHWCRQQFRVATNNFVGYTAIFQIQTTHILTDSTQRHSLTQYTIPNVHTFIWNKKKGANKKANKCARKRERERICTHIHIILYWTAKWQDACYNIPVINDSTSEGFQCGALSSMSLFRYVSHHSHTYFVI